MIENDDLSNCRLEQSKSSMISLEFLLILIKLMDTRMLTHIWWICGSNTSDKDIDSSYKDMLVGILVGIGPNYLLLTVRGN